MIQRRSKQILVCAFLMYSSMAFCQWESHSIIIPSVAIVDSNFLSIMDTTIVFEKKCNYYSDSLCFSLTINEHPNNKKLLFIHIESGKENTLLGLHPIAVFIHKGHYCFIYNEIPKILFNHQNNKSGNKFVYHEYKPPKGTVIIDFDDSFSYWVYAFENNTFDLVKSFSWCE